MKENYYHQEQQQQQQQQPWPRPAGTRETARALACSPTDVLSPAAGLSDINALKPDTSELRVYQQPLATREMTATVALVTRGHLLRHYYIIFFFLTSIRFYLTSLVNL